DTHRTRVYCQAAVLGWRVESVFRAGAAGAFVFAWTDEWHRGGFEIDDWDFGLTRRDRTPKPPLPAVAAAYAELPLKLTPPPQRVSVIVCSYNGSETIEQTLDGL